MGVIEAIKQFEKHYSDTAYCGDKKSLKKNSEPLKKISWHFNIACKSLDYFEDTRLLSIGNVFIKLLDLFEKNKTAFDELGENGNFDKIITLENKVSKLLIDDVSKDCKKEAAELRDNIAWRVNALTSKIKNEEAKAIKTLPKAVENQMEDWYKKNRPIIEDGSSLSRTPESVKIRREALVEQLKKYPSFVDLLEKHPNLVNLAMDWAVRDGLVNMMETFVTMPTGYQWIKKHFLATRISKFSETAGQNAIKLEGKDSYKELHLPFQNQWKHIHADSKSEISLGDEKLGTACTTTFKRIKKELKNKGVTAGNFEFLPQVGLSNINLYEMGWYLGDDEKGKAKYKHIDFTKENWIDDPLLPVQEIIKEDEAIQRYTQAVVEKGTSVLAARVSRQDLNNPMEVMRTHAWLQYAKKTENGYRLFDFGTYPKLYPTTASGQIILVGGAVEGGISGLDENSYYTHRQHKYLEQRSLNEKQEKQYLKVMGIFLNAAQKGKWAFQFLFHACPKLVEMIFSELFPKEKEHFQDLFQVNVLEAKPAGPSRFLANILNSVPKALRFWTLLGLALILGGWRSTETTDTEGNIKRVSLLSMTWAIWSHTIKIYVPGKPFAA